MKILYQILILEVRKCVTTNFYLYRILYYHAKLIIQQTKNFHVDIIDIEIG